MLLAVVLSLAPASARADGGCPSHRATESEVAFERSVRETLVKALPSPPAGWKRNPTRPPPPDETQNESWDHYISEKFRCDGPEPVEVRLFAEYSSADKERRLQRNREEERNAGKAAAAGLKDTQAEYAAAVRQNQKKDEGRLKEIQAQMNDAAKRRDMAEVQRLGKELQRIIQEEQAAAAPSAAKIKSQTDALDAQSAERRGRLLGDVDARIDITVNHGFADSLAGVKPVVVAGAALAYRDDSKDGGARGWTKAYAGAWRAETREGRVGKTLIQTTKLFLKRPPDPERERAYGIVVSVDGEAERARDLLNRMNWAALNSLLH